MTAADLIGLGCPSLPAGHFYRVGDTMNGYLVQIRTDTWYGSKRVSAAHVDRYTDPDTGKLYDEPISLEDAIVVAAKWAVEHRAALLSRARWTGDHR